VIFIQKKTIVFTHRLTINIYLTYTGF